MEIKKTFLIILSILIIFLIISGLRITEKKDEYEEQRNYYKTQMINLCELSILQSNLLVEITGDNTYISRIGNCENFIWENLDHGN